MLTKMKINMKPGPWSLLLSSKIGDFSAELKITANWILRMHEGISFFINVKPFQITNVDLFCDGGKHVVVYFLSCHYLNCTEGNLLFVLKIRGKCSDSDSTENSSSLLVKISHTIFCIFSSLLDLATSLTTIYLNLLSQHAPLRIKNQLLFINTLLLTIGLFWGVSRKKMDAEQRIGLFLKIRITDLRSSLWFLWHLVN